MQPCCLGSRCTEWQCIARYRSWPMCMGSDLAAHIMQQFQKFTDDLKNIYTVRAYLSPPL
ncbi:hypothetical protein APX70_01662 [Pseudomonas syringae pv. maculicola]|uniref:Uncharacterized protein n=1 Tax=Pseudomonas syringae pv. maculicola TaxID=59511 RepID=A0A3M2TU75_PSEYM|nr:hypothetical protein APX70_01662 [Pseudomonas syringae pv. maculicola]